MKFTFLLLSLVLLVSCKNTDSTQKESSSSQNYEEESPYVLPQIGFQKSFNLNYRLEWLYETITVNPNGNGSVLGDRPFYVEIDADNHVKISFYSSQYLKSVSYIDFGSTFNSLKFSEIGLSMLNDSRMKSINDFTREFTYGETNFESPEQDMLNKVFLIETQESNHPFKSSMKILFWLSCRGGFQKSATLDKCGNAKLNFNYKLVDYKLSTEK